MTVTRYADPAAVSGGDGTERTLTGSTAAFNSLNQWAAARYTYENIAIGIERVVVCNISGTDVFFVENHSAGTGNESFTNYADYVGDPLTRHRGVYDVTKARLAARTSFNDYAHVMGLQNGRLGMIFSDYCVADRLVSLIPGTERYLHYNFLWVEQIEGQVQNRVVYDGLMTNCIAALGGLGMFVTGNVVLVNCSGGYGGGNPGYIFGGGRLMINCLANVYEPQGVYDLQGFQLDNGGEAYNCASSDDSLLVYEQNGRGFNCRHNQTFQMYDFMNYDYHLLETDTGARRHGVFRAETTQFDVAGKNRARATAMDIGAFQITGRPYPMVCNKPDWRNGG